MTDRELCDYIIENYKPEKGTAIFFDLRNYHLCGLKPRILRSHEELILNCLEADKEDLYAYMHNYVDGIRCFFSYKEFYLLEHLSNWQNHDFDLKIEIDMMPFLEQIEEGLQNMIEALRKAQRS